MGGGIVFELKFGAQKVIKFGGEKKKKLKKKKNPALFLELF